MKKKQKIPAYIKFDEHLFRMLSLFYGDDEEDINMPTVFIAMWEYLVTGNYHRDDLTYREHIFLQEAFKQIEGDVQCQTES